MFTEGGNSYNTRGSLWLLFSGLVGSDLFDDKRIIRKLLGLYYSFIDFGISGSRYCDVGKGAGRLLMFTALLAYGFTIFSGFFTYFTCV